MTGETTDPQRGVLPAREPKVLSIVGCARCHGDGHDDLRFEPLDHPVELAEGREAEWWAACPTNGQPILLAEWNDPGKIEVVRVTATKLDE